MPMLDTYFFVCLLHCIDMTLEHMKTTRLLFKCLGAIKVRIPLSKRDVPSNQVDAVTKPTFAMPSWMKSA